MLGTEVLGIREDRTYQTPALNSAKERAKQYWAKAREFGPIAFDSETHAILNQENKSVGQLFSLTARMALSGSTHYSRNDGTSHGTAVIIEEPGGRRWDQRSLAVAAQMSPTTARKALKRLQQLGLLWFEVTPGRCTYIFVKGLQKFARSSFWRLVMDPQRRKKEKRNDESKSEKKSVPVSGTFPPPPNVSRSLTSTVDVPTSESKLKKEMSADVLAAIRRLQGR